MPTERFSLHYDPELCWTSRTQNLWRQAAARMIPALRYGGWVLVDSYGNYITYADRPSRPSTAATAQARAAETITTSGHPGATLGSWTPRRSAHGLELYDVEATVVGPEPADGSVLLAANGRTSLVRIDGLAPAADPACRWFEIWTSPGHGRQVNLDGTPWFGITIDAKSVGPHAGKTVGLEDLYGPFTNGDVDLLTWARSAIRAQRRVWAALDYYGDEAYGGGSADGGTAIR